MLLHPKVYNILDIGKYMCSREKKYYAKKVKILKYFERRKVVDT